MSLTNANSKSDGPDCHVCGYPLTTPMEARIGVHVRCVHSVKQTGGTRIPPPAYGFSRDGDG